MKRMLKNRSAQIFMISIILAITGALISSYILLKFMYEPKNDKEFLGSYQSGIVDALADGDKTMLYVDLAAKMAVNLALDEYINGNDPPSLEENSLTDGITVDEFNDIKNCGNYVYRLWNNNKMNCYPGDYNSRDFVLNALINKNLASLNYMNPNSKEPVYIDKILKQNIKYTYKYYPDVNYTKIYAFTSDKYVIGIFRDQETKKSSDIQQYLSTKSAYTGELIWPLKNNYNVDSCFGFRGIINAGAGNTASVNHPGLDIGAPFDTPVYAAAAGVVPVEPVYPTWGIVTIDHGGGLLTSYTHLNKILVKAGDQVSQGQQIGTVGGRSNRKENNVYPQNGDYNSYAPHLHFSVISNNVDPNANYKGIKAVVIGNVNNDRYVNPICFINSEDAAKVTISTSSLACNSICYQPGSSQCYANKIMPNYCQDMSSVKCLCSGNDVYSKSTCSADSSNLDNPQFKFCSVYKDVITKTVPCAKADSDDVKWEIIDVKLSSTSLKSDQILKISMTLENKGDVCVNVRQKLGFITMDDNLDITFNGEGGSVNLYKATSDKQYVTSELSCTFTSDPELRAKEEKAGKCVLWFSDTKQTKYTISTITALDYNDKVKNYNKELTFTVSKGSDSSTNNNLVISNVQLTPGEQATIDKTKERLESLSGVMDEIKRQASETGVPEEIMLATITLESVGENHEIKLPSNRAIGIKQIEGWQHYDKIASICGKEYVAECDEYTECDLTKTATSSCSKDLADKCQFKTFHDDPVCQIKVGADILKKNYEMYGTNDAAYIKAVNSKNKDNTFICDTEEYRNKYLTYTGWQRALRAYNGFGCNGATGDYVELVMKYASGWGYRAESVSIAKDEANKGILGTYKISPTFNTKIDFDLSLFDLLNKFANKTILECGKEGVDKKDCVQKGVAEFNKALPAEYTNQGKNIQLSMSCDNTPKIAAVNKFIEEINNCAASSDTDCQCIITSSDERLMEAKSTSTYTAIKYESEDKTKQIYIDYSISYDGELLSEKSRIYNRLYLNELEIYKDSTGKLNIGKSDSDKKCTPVKNKYRFCLKTNYIYTIYDPISEKMESEPIVVPFALIIRNQIAPKAVTGIKAENMPHTNDNVILKWNKSDEKDVVKYDILVSSYKGTFDRTTENIKLTSNVISVSSNENSYIEYKNIDTNPVCKLMNSNNVDYCVFEYSAVDKSDKEIKIELRSNVLYYLSQTNEFMYIINNTNKDKAILVTNVESFIGIVAGDLDGNEMDNADGSSYVLNKNLINITPQDNLEAGFSKIISAQASDQNTILSVKWTPVIKYIDGTEMVDTSNIVYSLYMLSGGSCPTDLYSVSQTDQLSNIKYSESEAIIDISNRMQGDYCIGVIANKTKEYPSTFLTSTNIPALE